MKKLIFAIICLISFEASAQQKADTTIKKLGDTIKKDLLTAPDTVKKLHSKPYSLVIPGAAIAYGVSSFVINPVRRVDYYIYGDVKR
ncbi:MAG: hypothetical protein M3N14_02570, partial [Bacteroidota bacterium]|nr:hypothetical protein [Bacteroidota bacterium]